MSTLIPKAIDLLKSFAEQTVRGLHFLGAMLGITYNTEADVIADLDALNKANSESQTAKGVLKAARQPSTRNPKRRRSSSQSFATC